MDAFIGLLVILCGVAAFVMMVRRTNAKGRALAETHRHKPELLTPQQRKALKRHERKPAAEKPAKTITPKPATSRAMRQGWSLGQVAFTYEDSAGDVSYRKVTVHSITASHMKGECHDRQAERTFRLDRIIGDLTDCDTGEIMSPTKWARRKS